MAENHFAIARTEPSRGWFGSIRTRLAVCFSVAFAVAFILVEVIGFIGIPFTSYGGRLERHRLEARQSLDLIADLKVRRLRDWIQERRNDVRATIENRMLLEHARSLQAAVEQWRAEGLDGDELRSRLREQPDYAILSKHFDDLKNVYGEYARVLLAAASGDEDTAVVLVSTDEGDVGTDVGREGFFVDALDSDEDAVGDVHRPAEGLEPILRISRAASSSGNGPPVVLSVDIVLETVLGPMLHTGAGLGERGEALLVNRDAKILVPLKHPLADGSRPGPLEYQVKAQPAVRAARGEEGIVETPDYRGVPVLAAYRHIHVAPDVGWGIVVKRDRAELLAPILDDTVESVLFGSAAILAAVLLTFAVARTMTGPIRSLSRAAERVAEGDLAARAPVITSDEVGALAATFNTMVDRVQYWQENLEAEVRNRTAELGRANKQLTKEIDEHQRAEQSLRESEERYRALFENMTNAVAVYRAVDGGEDFIFEDFNSAGERIEGVDRKDILGKRVTEAFPGVEEFGLFEVFQRVWRTGQPEYLPEGIYQDEHHGEVWRENWVYRLPSGEIVAVYNDITERKRGEVELAGHREHLEELVRERTDELQEAQEALIRQERLAVLGQLTATVSHELRNPLGTIRTSLFSITRRLHGKELGVDRALDRIERSILRCNGIIADLLDFSRSRTLDVKPTDVAGWLAGLLEEYEVPKGITLQTDLQAGPEIPLDRERFRRCMINVLNNACEAMRPKGGRLTVIFRRENGRLVVRIVDSGCGILPERMGAIFDPLYSTKSFGVGLGLSIVQQIMRLHHGGVEVESRQGRGTTVVLWLPVAVNNASVKNG